MNSNLPALLVLGPGVVKKSDDFQRLRGAIRAYREGKVTSLRKARVYCTEHAKEWGIDECLFDHWGQFQRAVFVVERLFSRFFQTEVRLFIRLGEGMPWIGLTDWVPRVEEPTDDFLKWCALPDVE